MLKKNNNKSNKLPDPPPSLIIIKIHSRLPREGGGDGGKGEKGKKGSVEGVCQRLSEKTRQTIP